MSLFATNDELFSKLKAGNPGFDVIVPSNEYVTRLRIAGLLQPLDLAKIPPALFMVNDSFLMSNGIAAEQAVACVYKNGHIASEQQNESDAFALGSEELPTVTRILARDFAGIETAHKVRITFLHDPRKGPVVTLELVNPAHETPDVRVVNRRP